MSDAARISARLAMHDDDLAALADRLDRVEALLGPWLALQAAALDYRPPVHEETRATPALSEVSRARALAATGEGRTIRERAGVSLREVARAIDVTPSVVSRWERGVSAPRGKAGARWAALLDDLDPRNHAQEPQDAPRTPVRAGDAPTAPDDTEAASGARRASWGTWTGGEEQ